MVLQPVEISQIIKCSFVPIFMQGVTSLYISQIPLSQYGSPYIGPAYLRGYISQYAPCIGVEIAIESSGDRV